MKLLQSAQPVPVRRETWLASIPQVLGPHEGVTAVDAVLGDARAALNTIRWSMKGERPRMPWPASPRLVETIDRLGKVRAVFAAYEAEKPDARWPRDGSKAGSLVLQLGTQLYAELNDVEERAARARTEADLRRAFPSAAGVGGIDVARMLDGIHPAVLLGGLLLLTQGRGRSKLRALLP